jgi:hypothetical protein
MLAGKAGIEMSESVLDRLAEYTEFHLESRYPDERKEFYAKMHRRIYADIDPRIEPIPILSKSYENDTWVPLIYHADCARAYDAVKLTGRRP